MQLCLWQEVQESTAGSCSEGPVPPRPHQGLTIDRLFDALFCLALLCSAQAGGAV